MPQIQPKLQVPLKSLAITQIVLTSITIILLVVSAFIQRRKVLNVICEYKDKVLSSLVCKELLSVK